jgi:hypothetical protein
MNRAFILKKKKELFSKENDYRDKSRAGSTQTNRGGL